MTGKSEPGAAVMVSSHLSQSDLMTAVGLCPVRHHLRLAIAVEAAGVAEVGTVVEVALCDMALQLGRRHPLVALAALH